MATIDDKALIDSVERLNNTATSLNALMKIVDKNQRLLVENQEATLENTDAISLRSTKRELLIEVNRLAVERKKDRAKTKFAVIGSFFISSLLILAIFITMQEFKNARHDANLSYAAAARNVCIQRNQTWDAMQHWITVQLALLKQDTVTDPALKAQRIAAYNALVKSFQVVDCEIESKLVGLPSASGLSSGNSALSIFGIR